MRPRVAGYVMARNEWPLLGLSVTHALNRGVDRVVVVDHASDDNTSQGLMRLCDHWGERIEVVRIDAEIFLQEAVTALVCSDLLGDRFDWLYVFDADEFVITRPLSDFGRVLARVPSNVDVVRYHVDQWVVPRDLDAGSPSDFLRVRDRAVPSLFIDAPGEYLADEVSRGAVNFFDISFPSKVIVRQGYFHLVAAGAHRVNSSRLPREISLDPDELRVGHVPIRSRQQLDSRSRQGRALREAGFPRAHGWQNQMLYGLDLAGHLDEFWQAHSAGHDLEGAAPFASRPVTVDDPDLSVAIQDSVRLAESPGTEMPASCPSSVGAISNVKDGPPWRQAMKAMQLQLVERDGALAERDAAFMERDVAFVERDRALAERDAVLVERDRALAERDVVLVERDAALVEVSRLSESESDLEFTRQRVAHLTHLLEAEMTRAFVAENKVARLRMVSQELDAIRRSRSWRVGRVVTAPFRGLRRALSA